MAVHVWTAVVDRRPAVLGALARTLSPAERARTGSFRFERHRVRHLFRRGMLRCLLGRYVGLDPARLEFAVNAFGKPRLAGAIASAGPAFNLSHSGDIVVVAVAAAGEVGVDVEAVRPIAEIEAIARDHFAATERAQLAAATADRELTFLRLWTRKEAVIKAVGGGLSIPLSSFDVSMPEVAAAPDAHRWWLSALPLPPGCVGALAVDDGGAPIECRQWSRDA